MSALVDESAASREALARAWDVAAPGRIGGAFSQSAALPRQWLSAGTELRVALGLSFAELVPSHMSSFAAAASLAAFAILALLLARALALALGSSFDAAAWASFAAVTALVLDVAVPARCDSRRASSRSATERAAHRRRLDALCRWANGGALLRSGLSLRDDVITAVRRGIPEFRVAAGCDGVPADAEVERLLRIWHPGLQRKVARSLAGILPADKGTTSSSNVVVTYLNLSVAEAEGRGVWR